MATISGLFEAPASHEGPGSHEAPGSFEGETYESGAYETLEDPFATRVIPIPGAPGWPEGHEVLTRAAASGLSGIPMGPLLFGVVLPDRGPTYWHFPKEALHSTDPVNQPTHALRATATTSVRNAVRAVRRHIARRYRAAMSSPGSAAGWQAVGEALHTIQDSFSTAHADRSGPAAPGGSNRIRYVRHFDVNLIPPRRTRAPREHNFPADSRDQVHAAGGGLRPESRAAVIASREFLVMMQRHFAAGRRNPPEVLAFLNRHVSI
jgi:hypothetical protein